MSDHKNIILYHAYGLQSLYQQVIFSILTLYYHQKGNFDNIQIVIYTDKPGIFERYAAKMPIMLEELTPDMIKNFKGSNGFVHRVKICVIKACLNKYNSNILYLDSDTYFLSSPTQLLQQINAGYSIMNTDDYDLIHADEKFENEDWLLIRRAIRNYNYHIEGKTIKIPLNTRMWNAGVIGLSVQNKSFLDQVLDLTDQIYTNKKVFTAEQFAFSYFLQLKTKLKTSGNVIFHYWPNFTGGDWKGMYNKQFKKFFSKNSKASIEKQALLAYQLTMQHDQLVKPKKLSFVQKIIRRIDLVYNVAVSGKFPK
jgi:hypothetical protein